MPFERYGVLAGVLQRHFRDQPDDQGRWFHVNLRVDAPAGRYKCAVDVDSKLDVFVSKFSTQADRTGDDGHPA
ncbi:DUF2278 family protein [Actinoplanes sp. Pm04-4]|uniref:DUF2278 family protein n=1 Tax=Paractinoplanes pyxinae TaxID=2997416 RepID=A0ABT4B4S9_9ACTN|nr:DUF2278 family protein [Actinoplanes pyxinae]MCY1140890.1 DUF2278 family protein [Actinoplanes pyxinae]